VKYPLLFWNDLGYRMLHHQFDAQTWQNWALSSGQFWDLFLAGCHQYGPADVYGNQPATLPLTPQDRTTCLPGLSRSRVKAEIR